MKFKQKNAKWTWMDFLKRFEEKKLGFADIDPLWIRLALPFLLISGAGPLLIDSENDLLSTRSSMSIAIVFLIFSLAMHGMLSGHAKWPRPSLISTVWMIIWPILLGVIHAGLALGYILWINALFGEQKRIIISGPVIMKDIGGGRYTGKDHYLTIKHADRPVKLAVTAEDYTNYPLGTLYSRKMIYGGLGIYYSWGSGLWK